MSLEADVGGVGIPLDDVDVVDVGVPLDDVVEVAAVGETGLDAGVLSSSLVVDKLDSMFLYSCSFLIEEIDWTVLVGNCFWRAMLIDLVPLSRILNSHFASSFFSRSDHFVLGFGLCKDVWNSSGCFLERCTCFPESDWNPLPHSSHLWSPLLCSV